jgi:hypothetical protein
VTLPAGVEDAVRIVDVKTVDGVREDGTTWRRYDVRTNENVVYSTFNDALAERAVHFQQTQHPVLVRFRYEELKTGPTVRRLIFLAPWSPPDDLDEPA